MIINSYRSSCTVLYRHSFRIVIKLEFPRQVSEKYLFFRFQNVPWGKTDGQTDRHDEANRRFSQFCASSKLSVKFELGTAALCTEIQYSLLLGFLYP